MTNWDDIKDSLGDAASRVGNGLTTAGSEGVDMARRNKLKTAAGLLTVGAVGHGPTRDFIWDHTGEELLESPLVLGVSDINNYNERANNALSNIDSEYREALNGARETEVGRVPLNINPGDTFVDGKYQVFSQEGSFPSPDTGDDASTFMYNGQDNEWISLTDQGYEVHGIEGNVSIAINEDDDLFDRRDLKDIEGGPNSQGYRHMAQVAKDKREKLDNLITMGETLLDENPQYQDSDNPGVTEVSDNVDDLRSKKDQIFKDELRFRSYATLFDSVESDTQYADDQHVGEREQPSAQTTTPTTTPTDTVDQYLATDAELTEAANETTDSSYKELLGAVKDDSGTQNTFYRQDGEFRVRTNDQDMQVPEEVYSLVRNATLD